MKIDGDTCLLKTHIDYVRFLIKLGYHFNLFLFLLGINWYMFLTVDE